MVPQLGQLCERARQWTSLRTDGELSQLESALLDAHLASCAGCRDFAADVAETTVALRSVPLLEPAAPLDVRLPRHRRHQMTVHLAGAAAVLAAMMVGGALGVHALTGGGTTGSRQTAMVSSADFMSNFRTLRRAQLLVQSHPIPRNKAFS